MKEVRDPETADWSLPFGGLFVQTARAKTAAYLRFYCISKVTTMQYKYGIVSMMNIYVAKKSIRINTKSAEEGSSTDPRNSSDHFL
jgi:hypothetical protein